MTAHSILERLVTLVPDFAVCWNDPGNCFREDDGARYCSDIYSLGVLLYSGRIWYKSTANWVF